MKTKTVTLYNFDELSETAKDRARDWWRESLSWDEWWLSVYEDAEQVDLKITGFDLDRAEISGKWIEDACATAHGIVDNHGETCDTYKTAAAFLAERDKLVDEWPRDEDGEHEDVYELDNKLDDLENEFLHDILEDYRIMLQKELDYQESDEQVDEAITANEYTFTEDGKRED